MAEPDPALRPETAARGRRPGAPAADARRVHRPAGGAGQPRGLHRERAAARPGDGPHAVLRAAGPRQDHAGADHGARARGELPHDLGAGAGAGRRSGGDPDQPRRPRRAVHRRDPPAEPGGRGDPLPGARGLPARPGDRRGAGGAHGADRAAAVHPGRRHHPARAADDAAARPLRHPDPARVLRGRRAGRRSSPARRGCSGPTPTPDGALEIARRARGTPRIAGRLLRRVVGFRHRRGRRQGDPRGRRPRR